ncbi:HU family DNA-binding protein, partial [Microbacterium sp. ARD31]|uniref:HU family DNA-binding protein n=1 Tax=Microbacterium sp. ARD31 TaxID=2962576 RepID=UPI00288244EC
MNKSELIDALAARYEGNRKQAAHALESVLDTITREVAKGEKVAITGFGSFEKAVRNARWVRNPQTGERIKSKKKSVPKFSAGKELKDVISGAKKLPKLTAATMPKPPGVRAVAGAVTGTAAKKAAPAKTTASKSTSSGTAAKKTT